MEIESKVIATPFFLGDGEMGRLVREKDWAATSLGPMELWPASLRTAVSICLNSKFPMLIYWGTDLVKIYNDSYINILGAKHPQALGTKGAEIWPEVWGEVGEVLHKIMYGGQATWAEDQLFILNRNGVLEECYFTYSYSPIFNEAGMIGGIFCVVTETTAKIKIHKTSEDAEKQLSFTIDSAELGIWDLNPATNEFVGNARLKNWFGLTEDATIELSNAINSIAPEDKVRVEGAIANALKYNSGGNYEVEYSLIHPVTRQRRNVLAKGKALFTADQLPYKFSGILQDITEQKMAAEELRRFKFMADNAREKFFLIREDGTFAYLNQLALEHLGYSRAEVEKLDISVIDQLHQDSLFRERFSKAQKDSDVAFETIFKTKSGLVYPVEVNMGLLMLESKPHLFAVARNITDRLNVLQKLRDGEERLRLATEGTQLATWDLNVETREIIHSPRLARIFGQDESIMLTHPQMRAIIHPDDVKLIVEPAFELALTTGKYYYEARVVHPDQSIHWIRTDGKVVFDANHKPLRMLGTIRDITEQKVSKQLIEESEQRFRTVADTAPVLIWMTDTEKRPYFFNKSWLQFTGRSMVDEMEHGWISSVHPDDLNNYLEIFNPHFDERKEFYMEYRLKRADGEYRWISDHGVPRFAGDGIFEGYIGGCMDIHDRVVFEEKLKESESRLRIAALSSELGTWDYNPVTEVLVMDYASRELFGLDKFSDINLDIFWSRMHPDDRETALSKMLRALDPEIADTYDTEYRLVGLPDEETRWIHAKGKALFDEVRKPYRFSGTILDITEKRLALEELKESEQAFRLLADSLPQFIWTGDAMGNLHYFNQSVYNYSGLTQKQIADDGWLQAVHPDDLTLNIEKWMHSMATSEDFLLEHRFRRYDGAYRWHLSRAFPQKDEEGNTLTWVGTSTDIHDHKLFTDKLEIEVKERTKELIRLNEDLIKSNDELAQFAYVASHDLQEPLRKIQTFANRLMELEQEKLSEKGKDYFNRMHAASIRMQQLIIDLLSYSRTNTDDKHFKKTDLNGLLITVKDQLKDIIDQKKAIVTVENLPVLSIIPYQFEQLFTNLINNSLKFSKLDEIPRIKITTNLVNGFSISQPGINPANNYHQIIISDNGIGFDNEYNERIFQVFQRLHGKTEYAGTGIGLSIVKKVVENHNGIITARGELNKGASFIIWLPVEFD